MEALKEHPIDFIPRGTRRTCSLDVLASHLSKFYTIPIINMADNTSSLPETTTAKSSTSTQDATFYNWSTFFSILSGGASQKERAAYFDTKDLVNEERDCTRCEKDKAWLLQNSPVVRFMRHNINLLGQDLNAENMRCKRCTTAQSGGFDPEYGILLCANKFRNRGHLEDTMAHEMVHAYDHLRFKLDPYDLRHAACMEVSNHALPRLVTRADSCFRSGPRLFQANADLEGSFSQEDNGKSHSNCKSVSEEEQRFLSRTDQAVKITPRLPRS